MYGLVNLALQELLVNRFGEQQWSLIKRRAGLAGLQFARMAQYPDEVTDQLVDAASELLGVPADQILQDVGQTWVRSTGRVCYGHLFGMAGSSLREFLFNLDNLHTRVGHNFAHMHPPSFQFEDLPDGRLLMRYHSDRARMCPMLLGLLRGLGEHFQTAIEIQHAACKRDGADHCELLLQIGAAHA